MRRGEVDGGEGNGLTQGGTEDLEQGLGRTLGGVSGWATGVGWARKTARGGDEDAAFRANANYHG